MVIQPRRLSGLVVIIALVALAPPGSLSAQAPASDKKPAAAKPAQKSKPKAEADPLALQRRTVAISLLTSLADEARSYQNQTLRARVQARAADALWDSDPEKARTLFRRAWDSALSADKEAWRRFREERQRQSTARPNQYVQPPPELRAEVLRLTAKRDRDLSEDFLGQLTDDTDRDTSAPVSTNVNAEVRTPDPENPPLEVTQRLQLASQLLEEGDIGRALQFADRALDRVTTRGIFFLCTLREKDQTAADQRFATMLARTVADPLSDAVGVSVLSSYVFTLHVHHRPWQRPKPHEPGA